MTTNYALRGTLDAATTDAAVLQVVPGDLDSNGNVAIPSDARFIWARVINLSQTNWLRVWLKDAQVADGDEAGGWLVAPLGNMEIPMDGRTAAPNRLQIAGKASSAVAAALAVASVHVQAAFRSLF